MAGAIRSDGNGGLVISRSAGLVIMLGWTAVVALVSPLAAGWLGDARRDWDIGQVREAISTNAGQIRATGQQLEQLIDRWQAEHDSVTALAAQVGELDRRGAALTARRDAEVAALQQRDAQIAALVGSLGERLSGIEARLDVLLGAEGRRFREGRTQLETQSPASRQPASAG